MLLERAVMLEEALDRADLDAEVRRAEDGTAYVAVERDGHAVYAETGLEGDDVDLAVRFVSVLVEGGLL